VSTSPGTVYIVDDDAGMRRALERLCRVQGHEVRAFDSARPFLDSFAHEGPTCALLDVCLPDVNGPELHQEMKARGIAVPVVFITGHGDIPTSVRAMKHGAVDFLTKPFRDRDLLFAIDEALARDLRARDMRLEFAELRASYKTLTGREREVLDLVRRGFRNKQIAAVLGTSEQTIKVHRGRVMQKLKVASVAELVEFMLRLDRDG